MVLVITDGPVPKHVQLRAILERRCAEELKPGDALPGERVLEEEFGVSRITVRRAIGDLVNAGKLRRVRSKGTFVTPAAALGPAYVLSLTDQMRLTGVEATTNILTSASEVPPPDVSQFFHTDTETAHVHLQRLHLADGQPYAVDDAWYNAELVPDLANHDLTQSVSRVLESAYDLVITDTEQSVAACNADASQAALLDVAPATALLHVIRQARSGQRGVEYCASIYRTDRYRLQTRVARQLSATHMGSPPLDDTNQE